jgi:hypothetical protein
MEMNDMLFRTLLKRYEAVIEDAIYKIQSFNENNIIIPEHIDITGEVDKLLQIIAEAEDKLSIMRKYYGQKKADKAYYSQCICMVKKIKKKNKNYSKNNVILSLWSRSVGIYDFRVDKMLLKKVSCDRLFCHL